MTGRAELPSSQQSQEYRPPQEAQFAVPQRSQYHAPQGFIAGEPLPYNGGDAPDDRAYLDYYYQKCMEVDEKVRQGNKKWHREEEENEKYYRDILANQAPSWRRHGHAGERFRQEQEKMRGKKRDRLEQRELWEKDYVDENFSSRYQRKQSKDWESKIEEGWGGSHIKNRWWNSLRH